MRPLRGVAAVACACAALGCQPKIDVDGARAHARVVRQVEFGPRVPGTAGHAATRDWIAAELKRLGAAVEVQPATDTIGGQPLEMFNIVGRFGPATGRPIALVAHWDTRPHADRDPDSLHRGDPVPGANDGGSGVAVLLEVAEVLVHRPPRVPVLLVFVDGEDQGETSDEYCRGSRAWAARYAGKPDDPARPVAAFVFDMVGDRDLEIHPEAQSAARAANLVGIVLDAAAATGAKAFHPDPRWDVFDDHIPLLEAGIPAVDVIDFDYPAWHTHLDTPDQVSPESLAEVSRVAAWIVLESPLAKP